MSDLRRAARRVKPQKITSQIALRTEASLENVASLAPNAKLLLDTNVLISLIRGVLPDAVLELFSTAVIHQCTICKAEICVGIGNSDVSDSRWQHTMNTWISFFDALPAHRILNPDERVWTEAGLIAGTITRTQHYQSYQMKELLNDAAIYLTAAHSGLVLLTENRQDFDLIQQIRKMGRFAWY